MSDIYTNNRNWADRFISQQKKIIGEHKIKDISSLEQASQEKDSNEATDMVLKVGGQSISLRVRKTGKFRDFTIRTKSEGHGKTEIDKLKEGYGNYYLYCWAEGDTITEWMFLDIEKIRQSGLLIYAPLKNGTKTNWSDGTKFTWISFEDLMKNDCIINFDIEKYNHLK